MSAPAGWYPTPDGRERMWDGQAWTDEIRDPQPLTQPVAAPEPEATVADAGTADAGTTASAPTETSSTDTADLVSADPTAVLETTGHDTSATWDSPALDSTPEVDATSQIPTGATAVLPQTGGFSSELPAWQSMASGSEGSPAAVNPAAGVQGATTGQPGQPAYGQAAPVPPAYGQQVPPAYGQPGQPPYGQPGQPGYGQPVKSKSGKGCLIAALVSLGLLLILGIVGTVLFVRFVNNVKEDPSIILPSDIASAFPSGLPTDLPSDLPSDLVLPGDVDPTAPGGAENPLQLTVGEGFTIGDVTVPAGWSLETGGLPGLASIAMTATAGSPSEVPLMFDLTFYSGDTEIANTFCTAERTATAKEVNCLPVEDKAATATKVTAKASF